MTLLKAGRAERGLARHPVRSTYGRPAAGHAIAQHRGAVRPKSDGNAQGYTSGRTHEQRIK